MCCGQANIQPGVPLFSEALTSYREAIRQWVPLVSVHVFVRLVTLAVLVPIIGLLLAIAISFSDQPALTDQDIAWFLLTPAGAIGALVVTSFVLAAAIIDVAVMTTVLRAHARGIAAPLAVVFGFLKDALPRLVFFAAHLIIRILILSLPFLAAGAAGAAYLLGDYDINFYLTNRPPTFYGTIAFAGFCLITLAFVLLERMTAWAVAMHFSVFDLVSARKTFVLSRERMFGHRLRLVRRLIAWFVLRLILASVLAAGIGFLLAEIPQLFAQNLQFFFTSTAILLLVWVVLNTGANAIANGALADILNEEFDRCLEARPAKAEAKIPQKLSNYIAVPLGVLVLAVGSLSVSGALSNRVGGVEDIQVIAHRGAAGSRPENTMASVVKAIEDGADWVEIDVQETADGEVLVVHDSDFMKAAGVPTKVWDITMQEVANVDIGSWFDPAYSAERAPLLRDVLAVIKDRSKLLIELKYYGHDVDLENRVIALVEEAGMESQIATMSLKYPAVQKMRMLRPDWRSGVLAATALGNLAGLEGDFLAVSMSRVSAQLISSAHAADKDVYAWTVNDAVSMSRMISIGIDGLITDEPKLARDVIAYYETLSTPERLLLRVGDTIGFTFDFTPEESDI